MTIKSFIRLNLEYIVFFVLVCIIVFLILNRSFEGFFNEQNGINRLDAIIYINLENRSDRKDLLMIELVKLNTNMSKVHKVSGVFIPKNGHKGCVQSHILALNMIKMNKWRRVLILEDDAELDCNPETLNTIINQSLDILDSNHPDWNVIMLGSAHKVIDKSTPDIILNININDTSTNTNTTNTNKQPYILQKLQTATTSSAYIIKDTYVDTILNLFNNCNNNMKSETLTQKGWEEWALDQRWATIQRKHKWFSINKDPIKQRNIWSTIESGQLE